MRWAIISGMEALPVTGVPLYLVKIRNGEHAGRFVGPTFGGGLVTNPELLANPAVNIRGTKYALYAQEGPAIRFFEQSIATVQLELKQRGFETELVEYPNESLESRIRALMATSEHGETVEHLTEVLRVPSSKIHAALKKLEAQGYARAADLLGRD